MQHNTPIEMLREIKKHLEYSMLPFSISNILNADWVPVIETTY